MSRFKKHLFFNDKHFIISDVDFNRPNGGIFQLKPISVLAINNIMPNLNYYISTRDKNKKVTASEGIIQGLSDDGGLFVPNFLNELNFDLDKLKDLTYPDLAREILQAFLTDFSKEQIDQCIHEAYETGNFDIPELVNVTEGDNVYFLELWHGPTAAFKDMALTMLAHLMTAASKNINENRQIIILTATSGDTGKAALEGFKDVENTQIIVFYPKDGVSAAQQAQMNTTEGENTHVISVEGNFDDTQNGVKAIFNDTDLNSFLNKQGYVLSSANSINIGRLLPQIVYYYYSYFRLVENGVIPMGEPVNFIVPSGNFGDILAGYYAKLTGLPVKKLICASNKNNILTDFFNTGEYDINREFYKTSSPSMDILISSNLERLLYDKAQKTPEIVLKEMEELSESGKFTTDPKQFEEFIGAFSQEEEVFKTIKRVFEDNNILIDPHTAVGESVRKKLEEELGDTPSIVLSTANPFKFSGSVYTSLFGEMPEVNEFDLQRNLSEKTGIPIPSPLKDLDKKEIRHTKSCRKEDMKKAVIEALGIINE